MADPITPLAVEIQQLRDRWREEYRVAIEHDRRTGLRDTTIELGGKAIAADELDALVRRHGLQETPLTTDEEHDDLARQSSPSAVHTAGSPRSPQPRGSQR